MKREHRIEYASKEAKRFIESLWLNPKNTKLELVGSTYYADMDDRDIDFIVYNDDFKRNIMVPIGMYFKNPLNNGWNPQDDIIYSNEIAERYIEQNRDFYNLQDVVVPQHILKNRFLFFSKEISIEKNGVADIINTNMIVIFDVDQFNEFKKASDLCRTLSIHSEDRQLRKSYVIRIHQFMLGLTK